MEVNREEMLNFSSLTLVVPYIRPMRTNTERDLSAELLRTLFLITDYYIVRHEMKSVNYGWQGRRDKPISYEHVRAESIYTIFA